jgi:hypothetical protein
MTSFNVSLLAAGHRSHPQNQHMTSLSDFELVEKEKTVPELFVRSTVQRSSLTPVVVTYLRS